MSTSINVRLSDALEQKLKFTVNEIKGKAPLGAEVNNSTIIRGALENFINKIEEESKGIKTIKYEIQSLELNELEQMDLAVEQISKSIKDNLNLSENTKEKLRSIFINLRLEINDEIFKKNNI